MSQSNIEGFEHVYKLSLCYDPLLLGSSIPFVRCIAPVFSVQDVIISRDTESVYPAWLVDKLFISKSAYVSRFELSDSSIYDNLQGWFDEQESKGYFGGDGRYVFNQNGTFFVYVKSLDGVIGHDPSCDIFESLMVNSKQFPMDSLISYVVSIVHGHVKLPYNKTEVEDFFSNNILTCRNRLSTGAMVSIMQATVPHDSLGKVEVYLSAKDRDRDRKTSIKCGKFFKIIFPNLNGIQIESLTESFREQFSPINVSLEAGSERADFRKAYKWKRAVSRNMSTTSWDKSLSNSCMHGLSVDDAGTSPAEVYGSGDFKAIMAIDDKDHLAGRCVVMTHRKGEALDAPVAGPVYGSCTSAISKIREALTLMNAEQSDGSWVGGLLLDLEDPSGNTVGPYSDMESGISRYDSKYWEITDRFSSEYELDRTDGLVNDGGAVCEDCGCSYNPEQEGAYVEYDGSYCDDCLHSNFIFIESIGEYCRSENCVEVWSETWGGGTTREWDLSEGDYIVFCDPLDEYWSIDDTMYSESHNTYVPCMYADEDYYISNDYWDSDQLESLGITPDDDDDDEDNDDDAKGKEAA